jgi:hypothetical protein
MSERLNRTRIGTLGHPDEVWTVYTVITGRPIDVAGFYDREKAQAYAAAEHGRYLKTAPLKIMDA